MADDTMYADVAMLPRERPHVPSRTSVPGNTITYAELRVKPKPKRSSRPETSASGCQRGHSAWFYVALVLGVLVLVLMGVIAVLAEQFLKGRAGKSESSSQYDLNSTGDHISSEKTVSVVLLKWLIEELCDSGQGTTCELCPPGWQLHRARCYYFSEEAVSWNDSRRNCLARKSQLLVIEDEKEMEFIDNKEKDTKYIWIGSKNQDMDLHGQWNSAEDPTVKENRGTLIHTSPTEITVNKLSHFTDHVLTASMECDACHIVQVLRSMQLKPAVPAAADHPSYARLLRNGAPVGYQTGITQPPHSGRAVTRTETDKNCAVYRRKNIIQEDNCQTSKKWICKKNATLLVL
ncbi:C-type lectin domain family 7 member A-like [Rhynochetos jubatus]